MLKAKQELEIYLEKEIMKIISNVDICQNIYLCLKETYDIPRSVTSDFLTMRTPLVEASDFILFCLLDGIEKETKKKKSRIDEYFTSQEIKAYSVAKYNVDKIKFPLILKMIQVTDDQWIGKIDTKTLMKFRAAQLINYNVNAQRTMQRIIKGDKEIYKITINQATVNAIYKLYIDDAYIPTPFTLNIPQDINNDFYYDEDKNELVIRSLDHFDINDGYHRYVAACKAHDLDENFNYSMELRIVTFSEDKSKQFIYQQDQKTKMRKADSDSMNMNKAANIVVKRLNESPRCNLKGLINRNKGAINFADLAELVHYFYFKGKTTKDRENILIVSVVKELTEMFNMITEYNEKYLESYSYKQLVAVMFLFNYFKDNPNMICSVIDEVVERTEHLNNTKFYNKTPKKTMMNEIESIVKEVI